MRYSGSLLVVLFTISVPGVCAHTMDIFWDDKAGSLILNCTTGDQIRLHCPVLPANANRSPAADHLYILPFSVYRVCQKDFNHSKINVSASKLLATCDNFSRHRKRVVMFKVPSPTPSESPFVYIVSPFRLRHRPWPRDDTAQLMRFKIVLRISGAFTDLIVAKNRTTKRLSVKRDVERLQGNERGVGFLAKDETSDVAMRVSLTKREISKDRNISNTTETEVTPNTQEEMATTKVTVITKKTTIPKIPDEKEKKVTPIKQINIVTEKVPTTERSTGARLDTSTEEPKEEKKERTLSLEDEGVEPVPPIVSGLRQFLNGNYNLTLIAGTNRFACLLPYILPDSVRLEWLMMDKNSSQILSGPMIEYTTMTTGVMHLTASILALPVRANLTGWSLGCELRLKSSDDDGCLNLTTCTKYGPFQVAYKTQIPQLTVAYHQPPVGVYVGETLLVTCDAYLGTGGKMEWVFKQVEDGQIHRTVYNDSDPRVLSYNYTQEDRDMGPFGSGKMALYILPALKGFVITCFSKRFKELICFASSKFCWNSQPLDIVYLLEAPELTVKYHLMPNMVIERRPLKSTCFAYTGKDGTMAWSISLGGFLVKLKNDDPRLSVVQAPPKVDKYHGEDAPQITMELTIMISKQYDKAIIYCYALGGQDIHFHNNNSSKVDDINTKIAQSKELMVLSAKSSQDEVQGYNAFLSHSWVGTAIIFVITVGCTIYVTGYVQSKEEQRKNPQTKPPELEKKKVIRKEEKKTTTSTPCEEESQKARKSDSKWCKNLRGAVEDAEERPSAATTASIDVLRGTSNIRDLQDADLWAMIGTLTSEAQKFIGSIDRNSLLGAVDTKKIMLQALQDKGRGLFTYKDSANALPKENSDVEAGLRASDTEPGESEHQSQDSVSSLELGPGQSFTAAKTS